MTKLDDGGPAFPTERYSPHEGARLLDFFAAHALAGMLAEDTWVGSEDQIASQSYNYADAMLAEKRRREAGA